MKINKNIFLALITTFMVVAGCNEQFEAGEFDVDESLMPEPTPPNAPSAIIASFDNYCDRVEVNWMPSVRTLSYDLYKDGQLLAENLTDTFFVDNEANGDETEYTVRSTNPNGDSVEPASSIGRMASAPSGPSNFEATDGLLDRKVDLSWDAANFALYYVIKRGDVVLNDNFVGTSFSDVVDVPIEETEYSVMAVGACGQSDFITNTGYYDPSLPLNENFDDYEDGFNLSSLNNFQHIFQYDATGGPGSFTASSDDAVSGTQSAKAVYDDVNANTSKAGAVTIRFKELYLIEGERYRISYKLKCTVPTSMHMAVDVDGSGGPSKGDGIGGYLLPSFMKPNGNLTGIQLSATSEWKEISYEFPSTGALADGNLDPDATALGWQPTTIQAGQENPIMALTYWVGKNKAPNKQNPPIYIDDLKIEMIK